MVPAEAPTATIEVEVVYCPAPHVVDPVRLQLAVGARAIDAVRESGILTRYCLDEGRLLIGVWGRACEPEQVLRERDRVELYRDLMVDPKEARRQRYKGRARGAGGVSGTPTR